MPIAAGQLNRRAAFQRRAPMPTQPGQLRGGFEPYGTPTWAAYTERRPRDITMSGLTMTARTATLAIRDCAWGRSITRSDRVTIDGDVFDVIANALVDRRDGALRFELVEASSPAMYEREVEQRGEVVTLRRPGAASAATRALRAVVSGFTPDELASGVDQGARKVILLAADVEAAISAGTWPTPPVGAPAVVKNDQVVLRGAPMNIDEVDDSTHRVAGALLAYELTAVGF